MVHANIMHRELEQMEPRMNFQVPEKGLELVILIDSTKLWGTMIISIFLKKLFWKKFTVEEVTFALSIVSMTTLLTRSVAHSTKPSYRPKTNNQLLKKFLSLALICANVIKN